MFDRVRSSGSAIINPYYRHKFVSVPAGFLWEITSFHSTLLKELERSDTITGAHKSTMVMLADIYQVLGNTGAYGRNEMDIIIPLLSQIERINSIEMLRQIRNLGELRKLKSNMIIRVGIWCSRHHQG